MGISNAEKQRRHRERLKTQGLVHVQGWVTPAQAEAIKAIMQGEPVTYRPDGKPPQKPAQWPESLPLPFPATLQAKAPQRPPEAEKTPSPEEPRPKLKKGEQPGQWRVLIEGQEIGTVTKEHHAAFAGSPAYDRWKPHRKGSMLDALSERTYKNREQAVKALVSSVTR